MHVLRRSHRHILNAYNTVQSIIAVRTRRINTGILSSLLPFLPGSVSPAFPIHRARSSHLLRFSREDYLQLYSSKSSPEVDLVRRADSAVRFDLRSATAGIHPQPTSAPVFTQISQVAHERRMIRGSSDLPLAAWIA